MNSEAHSEPMGLRLRETCSLRKAHLTRRIDGVPRHRWVALWQVLLVVVQVAAAALPAFAQLHFGPHTEQEGASNSLLFTQLSESAATHLKPRGLKADLALVDGEFAVWEVVVRGPDAQRLLIELEQPTGDDLVPALLAWARSLNESLSATTARCFAEQHRDLFNPDVDCEVYVHMEALPVDIYAWSGLSLHFTGKRISRVGHPSQWQILARLRDEFNKQHGMPPTHDEDERLRNEAEELALKVRDRYPEPDPENVHGHTQLTYDIQVRGRMIRPGESICGTITLKNTGTGRLHVEGSHGIKDIKVLNAGGATEASRIRSRGAGIQIDVPEYEYVYLRSGESITSDFVINTDPQVSVLGGYDVSPGTYLLDYRGITNVEIVGERKAIEVLPKGEGDG